MSSLMCVLMHPISLSAQRPGAVNIYATTAQLLRVASRWPNLTFLKDLVSWGQGGRTSLWTGLYRGILGGAKWIE